MAKDKKLAACPCCGDVDLADRPAFRQVMEDGTAGWVVECSVCRLSTAPFAMKNSAANAWNRRRTSIKDLLEITDVRFLFVALNSRGCDCGVCDDCIALRPFRKHYMEAP